MARATKKSQDPVKKTKSSTSGPKSKKAKTAGRKDGKKASSRRCRTARRSKLITICIAVTPPSMGVEYDTDDKHVGVGLRQTLT
ncbi:hypothetical protein STEG23_025832 [Scotinomys teguina]